LNTVEAYSQTVGIDPGGMTMYTSLQRLAGIIEKTDYGAGIVLMDGLVKNHPNNALVIGLNVVDLLEAINSGALEKSRSMPRSSRRDPAPDLPAFRLRVRWRAESL